MKIIDGTNSVLGRLASFVAKEALKGEEIAIVNCEKIIITGNKKDIEKNFREKRQRGGHSQKGPKHHKDAEKLVKRSIRGMLPDHKSGRGKEILKKIKCYKGIPADFKEKDFVKIDTGKKSKFGRVEEFV